MVFGLTKTYICHGDLLFAYFYFEANYPKKGWLLSLPKEQFKNMEWSYKRSVKYYFWSAFFFQFE